MWRVFGAATWPISIDAQRTTSSGSRSSSSDGRKEGDAEATTQSEVGLLVRAGCIVIVVDCTGCGASQPLLPVPSGASGGEDAASPPAAATGRASPPPSFTNDDDNYVRDDDDIAATGRAGGTQVRPTPLDLTVCCLEAWLKSHLDGEGRKELEEGPGGGADAAGGPTRR